MSDKKKLKIDKKKNLVQERKCKKSKLTWYRHRFTVVAPWNTGGKYLPHNNCIGSFSTSTSRNCRRIAAAIFRFSRNSNWAWVASNIPPFTLPLPASLILSAADDTSSSLFSASLEDAPTEEEEEEEAANEVADCLRGDCGDLVVLGDCCNAATFLDRVLSIAARSNRLGFSSPTSDMFAAQERGWFSSSIVVRRSITSSPSHQIHHNNNHGGNEFCSIILTPFWIAIKKVHTSLNFLGSHCPPPNSIWKMINPTRQFVHKSDHSSENPNSTKFLEMEPDVVRKIVKTYWNRGDWGTFVAVGDCCCNGAAFMEHIWVTQILQQKFWFLVFLFHLRHSCGP